ncbi:SAM-dependent methyltransferase [Spirochaetia bacterium]|nr:SAM-dependent methyltransferase [Spirochaetia bacterium]
MKHGGGTSDTSCAFDAYYRSLYGERWDTLKIYLLEDPPINEFTDGLMLPYRLDRASVLAAQSLSLPESGLVLDACAAPGGKSLVIASALSAGAALLANELSSQRRRRLVSVLDAHLDTEKRSRVTVSGFDAAALAGNRCEHGRFDAVLLDAPCSSERHVLRDAKALAEWTPARPRFLKQRQWALLSAAFLLLKSGGSLVYSTCALTPEENDGVIKRLFEKYPGAAISDPPDFPEGEKTGYGRIILPDRTNGIGPMFVARIKKVPPTGTI